VQQAVARHPNLTYLGFQEKDVIMRYLRKSRGLLFPSLWYEGLPNTILEAYATGTPVVATNLGNINEIVRDGVTGLLFEKGDARSLARQVAALQSPACDWPALSRNARREYLEHYAPEKNYQALIRIYQTVTALRQPHYENP
jgi:glycosyltransferase involved in cell wall biosynthesis